MSEYKNPIINKPTGERYALSLGADGGVVALLDCTSSTNSASRPTCNFSGEAENCAKPTVFPTTTPMNTTGITCFGVPGLSTWISSAFGNTRPRLTCDKTTSTAMDDDDGSESLAIRGLSGAAENSIEQAIVPCEIAKVVKSLKSYIKAQKKLLHSEEYTSQSEVDKFSMEIETFKQVLELFSNKVACNENLVNLLQEESYKWQQSVEEAINDKTAPPKPWETFKHLKIMVEKYEQDLLIMTQQIAKAEAMINTPIAPHITSPEEIMNGIQQGHKILLSLASRGYELNARVRQQKELFLKLRQKIVNLNVTKQ